MNRNRDDLSIISVRFSLLGELPKLIYSAARPCEGGTRKDTFICVKGKMKGKDGKCLFQEGELTNSRE